MNRHLVAIGMAAWVSHGHEAAAQGQRTANGVFMSRPPAASGGQRVDFTLSSSRGYDDGGSATTQELAPNRAPTGSSTSVSMAGNYGWLGRWAQLSANGTVRLQQYQTPASVVTSSTVANRVANVALSKKWGRNTLSAGQTASYSSSAVLTFFPPPAIGESDPLIPADARQVSGNDVEISSYGSGLTYARQLSTRSVLRTTADRQQSTTTGATGVRQRLVVYGIRNEVSRSIRPHVALTTAYAYRYGGFGYGGVEGRRNSSEHSLDVGIDWSRPLSPTRRVTFSGRLGGTTSVVPRTRDDVFVDSRFNRASGLLSFGYDFGRSWQARASYRRGVEYIAGLAQPVFSDSTAANLGGLITRRLDFTVAAAFASGDSAWNRQGLTFDTTTGSTMLRFALARSLAVFADYSVYHYHTRGAVPLTPGFPRGFDRRSGRLGLTLNVRPFGS